MSDVASRVAPATPQVTVGPEPPRHGGARSGDARGRRRTPGTGATSSSSHPRSGVGALSPARGLRPRAYRAGIAVALAAASLSIWLKTGLDHRLRGQSGKRIYARGPRRAALGSLLARFRPAGMVRAMVAAAIAQALAFAYALLAGLGFTGPITVFFAGLWLIAAWLFGKAARDRGAAATELK